MPQHLCGCISQSCCTILSISFLLFSINQSMAHCVQYKEDEEEEWHIIMAFLLGGYLCSCIFAQHVTSLFICSNTRYHHRNMLYCLPYTSTSDIWKL